MAEVAGVKFCCMRSMHEALHSAEGASLFRPTGLIPIFSPTLVNMATTNGYHFELANTAATALSKQIDKLQAELIAITKNLHPTLPVGASAANINGLNTSEQTFLQTLDVLHTLAEYLPEATRQEVKSQLFGIENLWAMVSGFIMHLGPLEDQNQTIDFNVIDRFTKGQIHVVLPLLAYLAMSDDVDKTTRKVTLLRKKFSEINR